VPNKAKFSKETIIEAGLKLLKDEGWEGITPKKVAERLGASTMPIYSHFPTMTDFRKALVDEAWRMLEEYTLATYTGDPWVDQGIGYIRFARNHGQIFNCMHTGKIEEIQARRYHFWVKISENLTDYPLFQEKSPELVAWIRNLRSYLTYGIASSINRGLTPVWDNEELVEQMILLLSHVLLDGLSKRETKLINILELLPLEIREKVSRISLKPHLK
jgi:AcrR family transcriptional regulator